MALIPTGDVTQTKNGENRIAKDDEGRIVTIAATNEVIDDYGWLKILRAATTKYETGDFETKGKTRIVTIGNKDCAEQAPIS